MAERSARAGGLLAAAAALAMACLASHGSARAASPVVVDDAACLTHAVDIAYFATCDANGRVAVPRAELAPDIALPAAAVPAHKRSQTAMHIDAVHAYALKRAYAADVALVDVRAPVELQVSGMPELADLHVPFRDYVLPLKWEDATGNWHMEDNVAFAQDLSAQLLARGYMRDDVIVLMCRDGERSALAADRLAALGYMRVASVVDGFEGDIGADGERSVNGWKNAQLPWTVSGVAPAGAPR